MNNFLISLDHHYGDLIPVSLDTSNVIALGKPEAPLWYSVFQEMKKSNCFIFCLSDLATGELVRSIYNDGFDFNNFQLSMTRVSSLIDQVLPILPSGVDMEKICGIDIPRETFEYSVDVIIKSTPSRF